MPAFYVRPPESGEYEKLAACLTEARGPRYYGVEYYDADYLENSGEYEFLAAFTESGEAAGLLATSCGFFDDERATMRLLTTSPRFGGLGVGTTLASEFAGILRARGVRAVKAQAVTSHVSSQKILIKMGFTLTGIMYGVRDGKNAELYEGKASLVMYVGKAALRDAGKVYVHPHISGAARKLYRELGVEAECSIKGEVFGGASVTSSFYDAHNNVLYIEILQCGEDIAERLEALKREYDGSASFTMTVLLNISDASAVYGYDALSRAGFTFSGFDPLGEREHALFYRGEATLAEIKTAEPLPVWGQS